MLVEPNPQQKCCNELDLDQTSEVKKKKKTIWSRPHFEKNHITWHNSSIFKFLFSFFFLILSLWYSLSTIFFFSHLDSFYTMHHNWRWVINKKGILKKKNAETCNNCFGSKISNATLYKTKTDKHECDYKLQRYEHNVQ